MKPLALGSFAFSNRARVTAEAIHCRVEISALKLAGLQ